MSEETALVAFNKVLEEGRYLESAKRVSQHLHLPRARTPLQEAGGTAAHYAQPMRDLLRCCPCSCISTGISMVVCVICTAYDTQHICWPSALYAFTKARRWQPIWTGHSSRHLRGAFTSHVIMLEYDACRLD